MGGLRNPIRLQLAQGMERRMLSRSHISRENSLQPAKTLAERDPRIPPGNQIPPQLPMEREDRDENSKDATRRDWDRCETEIRQ